MFVDTLQKIQKEDFASLQKDDPKNGLPCEMGV
jgi:hypothetical protein